MRSRKRASTDQLRGSWCVTSTRRADFESRRARTQELSRSAASAAVVHSKCRVLAVSRLNRCDGARNPAEVKLDACEPMRGNCQRGQRRQWPIRRAAETKIGRRARVTIAIGRHVRGGTDTDELRKARPALVAAGQPDDGHRPVTAVLDHEREAEIAVRCVVGRQHRGVRPAQADPACCDRARCDKGRWLGRRVSSAASRKHGYKRQDTTARPRACHHTHHTPPPPPSSRLG